MEWSNCNILFCKKWIDNWLKIKKEWPNRWKLIKNAVIKPASKIISEMIKKMIISWKYCRN